MPLARFIRANTQKILLGWDEFAATILPADANVDKQALRDGAAQILATITADIEKPQSDAEQVTKSRGQADSKAGDADTAAQTHADARLISGVDVVGLIAEYRALRASVLQLWGKSGDPLRDTDLEQLTRFNEAIDQAIAESVARFADQTKRSTDLFLGVLGHDIRNPLGTICVSADYLVLSGRLDAKAAQPIINSASRIKSVIEHVVDFSRAQMGEFMPIDRRPGNLADQIAKVVEETRVRNPGKALMLEGQGNFEGQWDEGRVGQLLSNLLGNAILYGDPQRPVTVRMWEDEDQVSFSVHNYGPAIPVTERKRIFEPLVRGIADPYKAPGGLGLGLYICREIVRAHGGTVAVESDEHDGTTFTVHLPRAERASK